jgi:hypothetical protein
MIRLSVSASEKIGTNTYGSIGAQCGLEIELDSRLADEAGALHEAITRYQQIATTAMREHLGRMLGSTSQSTGTRALVSSPNATPAPQPNGKPANETAPTATTNGKAPAASPQSNAQNGKARTPAPEPRPEHVKHDDHEESHYTDEDDRDDDAPTTGRELLGWARRQSEDAFPWLVKTGKKLRYPDRILDWSQEQVGKAYAAYYHTHSNSNN